MIGGLIAAAVFLPLFVLIERHQQAPMLDLSIFNNRLFSAASAAAFINGLARFALMFLFVFYFQGVQGDSPILAGLKLAPLAVGMLISSPLAGIWADRRGSRAMASLGMLVTALGLALMTTLEPRHELLGERHLHVHRRRRLGHVQLAEHRRDDGRRSRRTGAGSPPARGCWSRTPAPCLSIAFVLAVVTSSVPKTVLFAVFSGLANHISNAQLTPFIANMHTALWCLAGDLGPRRGRVRRPAQVRRHRVEAAAGCSRAEPQAAAVSERRPPSARCGSARSPS